MTLNPQTTLEETLRNCTHPMQLALSLPSPTFSKVRRNHSLFEQEAISLVKPNGMSPFKPLLKTRITREDPDLRMLYKVIETNAFSPDGKEIGQCQFYFFRRLRGRPEMSAEWIAREMDNISSSESDMASTLWNNDEWSFCEAVNECSLIVAERIEIKPEFRGSTLWKELFSLTLRHSTESRRPFPDYGYLKAFPLQFEGIAGADNPECAKATLKLKQLYETNLSAECLPNSDLNYCYMQFPIGID